jgi:hypothetical protein
MSDTGLALALTDAPAAEPAVPAAELQELWLRLRRSRWTTLALVPGHAGLSLAAFARALGSAGTLAERSPIGVLVADGLDAPELSALAAELRARRDGGGLQIIALPSPLASPQSATAAMAADAAVLCFELGRTDLASARNAVERVGAGKFAGCVAVDSKK